MKKAKVLIADDDYIFCELTKYILTEHNFSVCTAKDSQTAIDFIEHDNCDLILLDLHFPDYPTGLHTLKSLKEKAKDIPIIIITSDNLILMNRFTDLIQNGASDIVEKPLQEERLLLTIKNTLALSELTQTPYARSSELIYLLGESPKITQLKNHLKQKLQTEEHIFIFGEPGTGVKNIAQKIHNLSHRNKLPLYTFDCSKMTIKEMQIALFGEPKEKDFAKKFNNLKIVQAKNSTLLIANVHLMPNKLQEKLVRALSGRKLNSLNSNSLENIDTKLIFTSNKECYNDICSNYISPMLFNLCQNKEIIPSLNERLEDIPYITNHLIMIYNQTTDSNISITESALDTLKRHVWENNVDELKNVLLKTILHLESNEITNKDITFHDENSQTFIPQPYKQAVKNFEKFYLEKIMAFKDWHLNDAAAVLKIDRSNLFKKLQKHGIKIKKN